MPPEGYLCGLWQTHLCDEGRFSMPYVLVDGHATASVERHTRWSTLLLARGSKRVLIVLCRCGFGHASLASLVEAEPESRRHMLQRCRVWNRWEGRLMDGCCVDHLRVSVCLRLPACMFLSISVSVSVSLSVYAVLSFCLHVYWFVSLCIQAVAYRRLHVG